MSARILVGDCRARLRELERESVHCVVTSPPYWGLRDYKIAPVVWGGRENCEHEWGDEVAAQTDHVDTARWNHTVNGRGEIQPSEKRVGEAKAVSQGQFCLRCHAWRGALGLEPTPDLYVAHIVEVFREVRRVLRKDGTLWLNLGDAYAGSWGAQGHRTTKSDDPSWHGSQINNHPRRASHTGTIRQAGLKPKDLIGIPWMVAFALRADGWWLRQSNIWHKPNPMPESAKDRPTCSYEHVFELAHPEYEDVFLLTRSARYAYDQDAVREPHAEPGRIQVNAGKQRPNDVKPTPPGNSDGYNPLGRNMHNVWIIPTEPYPEAHFATFPRELARRCILAGCPKGGIVLDPFGGSGTVGLVAERLGRDSILIDASEEYAAMAQARMAGALGAVESEAKRPADYGPLFQRTEAREQRSEKSNKEKSDLSPLTSED